MEVHRIQPSEAGEDPPGLRDRGQPAGEHDIRQVLLAGGACAGNVFWAPAGAATLGANAALSPTPTFAGNILAAAGITIGHFAHLSGRALAFGGTVTTDANTVTVPVCAAAPVTGGAIPTLSEWAMILLAGLLAIAGFAALRRQAA